MRVRVERKGRPAGRREEKDRRQRGEVDFVDQGARLTEDLNKKHHGFPERAHRGRFDEDPFIHD